SDFQNGTNPEQRKEDDPNPWVRRVISAAWPTAHAPPEHPCRDAPVARLAGGSLCSAVAAAVGDAMQCAPRYCPECEIRPLPTHLAALP
ncbi:MAG: hypothetical protein MUQ30_12940, partial [Anaerolineae bacterium]|nr:hypothetical protein [Anaerolineae bacterium]